MIVVTVYIEENDPSGLQVIRDLEELQADFPHQLALVDIHNNPALIEAYSGKTPMVQVGPYKLWNPITRQDLQVMLGAAQDRDSYLDKIGDQVYAKRIERGHHLSRADKISFWFSNHYMFLINILLGVYFGLPFVAPVLAQNGNYSGARTLQKIYSPLCHQLAYRSWFLFGVQPFYPRELAGIEEIGTYEEMIGGEANDLTSGRKLIGFEEPGFGEGRLGYKVVLCQRDVAIYGMLFIFGLIFSITGRKIKPIPWYLWIALGLIPIGIDGASQLPGLITMLSDWLAVRESTPVLRTITGGLFGLMTAWYLFPTIEESMRETRALLARKKAIVPQLQKAGRES